MSQHVAYILTVLSDDGIEIRGGTAAEFEKRVVFPDSLDGSP